jgi:hypothetical protein
MALDETEEPMQPGEIHAGAGEAIPARVGQHYRMVETLDQPARVRLDA